MVTSFRISAHAQDGWLTLELIGKVDGSSAAEIPHHIETLGRRGCTLDFSRVSGIDLFAARVLARGLRELRDRGVHFQVDGLTEAVAEKLCLGGVLEALV